MHVEESTMVASFHLFSGPHPAMLAPNGAHGMRCWESNLGSIHAKQLLLPFEFCLWPTSFIYWLESRTLINNNSNNDNNNSCAVTGELVMFSYKVGLWEKLGRQVNISVYECSQWQSGKATQRRKKIEPTRASVSSNSWSQRDSRGIKVLVLTHGDPN